MSVDIKYLGGIQDENVGLTGSSTLMNVEVFDNLKIVFDCGMFQGIGKENELNSLVDEEAIKADYIVITHSHMDHIGRLPLLVNKGFKGRIFMSNITKQLAEPMLNDYVNLTTNQIQQAEENNTSIKTRLREALTIVSLNEELSKNGLSKKEKEIKYNKLQKLLGNKTVDDTKKILFENNIKLDQEFTKNEAKKILKIQSEIEKLEFIKKELNGDASDNNGDEIIKLNKKIFKIKSDIENENDINIINELIKEKEQIEQYLDSMVSTDVEYDNYDINKKLRYLKSELKLLIGDLDIKKAFEIAKSISEQNIDEIISNMNPSKVPELLYDIDDIYQTLSMIETLDVGEELDLDNRIFITSTIDERIDKIPEYIKNGIKKKIYVSPFLKGYIVNKWKHEHDNTVKLSKEDKLFRKMLQNSLSFVKQYNSDPNSELNIPEGYSKSEFYNYSRELLKEYGISCKKDIDKLRKDHKLKYTKHELNAAKQRLVTVSNNSNQEVLEKLKLKFYNAGHIEGSVQALVTLVKSKINHSITGFGYNGHKRKTNNFGKQEIKTKHENYLFTGDLGKFKDPNYCGTPDIPEFKLDYIQCETTYALKKHPNKEIEFERFINEINSAEGKVLIPAFSLQRTQEIIIELLQNKENCIDELEEFKRLNKEKKIIKKEYNKLKQVTDLDKDQQARKIELFKVISDIDEKILKISNEVLLTGVITDSPLSNRISDIYKSNLPAKYKLLNSDYQKHTFGKEVIRNLAKGEFEELYSGKRKDSKDVIISSGGMLQGGAVINHLYNVVSDPKAKIIFTGYQSYGTLGEELLSGAKTITINGDVLDVKCEIVQIKGYSSHIGGDDIERYLTDMLNYSKGATISLTHGGLSREELRDNIVSTKKRVKVLVPSLGDNVKI